MKRAVLGLLGLGMLLTFPAFAAATPDYLIFGADYNYSGVVNANESITGSTVIRLGGSTDGDSFGAITQVPDGKWGGGMLVTANGNNQRARYDVPSGFDPYNGMIEVWFKLSSADKITLLKLGEDNLVRWDPGNGYLTAYLGSAGMTWYAGNIADGNWHHVALSWGDSGNWKKGKRLWFDGANVAWNDGNFSVLNPTSYIGTQEANAAGGSGDVYFDELHLYGPGWQNLVYWAPGQVAPGYVGEIGPLAQAVATTTNALIFGANYNQETVNANLNTSASLAIHPAGSNSWDSFGFIAQVPAAGKWDGGMRVCSDSWNSRVRYDVPGSFDLNNGLVEVWFKINGSASDSELTLIDLGGNNFARWIPSLNEIRAVLAGSTIKTTVSRLDDNQWHHLAISWGASGSLLPGKRLFFDGVAKTWDVGGTAPLSSVSYIGLGEPCYGGAADIFFDELHVYNGQILTQMYYTNYGGTPPGGSNEISVPDAVASTAQYTINTAAAGTSFSPGVRGHHPECVGVHRGEYLRAIPKVLSVSDGTMLRGLAAGLKAETYDWRNRFEYGVPANGLGQPTIDFLRYQRDLNSPVIITVNTRGLTRQVGTVNACEYYDTNLSTLTSLAADWVRYTNRIVQTYRLGDVITDSRDASILNSLSWKTAGDNADQFETLLFAQETLVPKVTYWEIGNEPMANLSANNSYTLTPTQFRDRYQAIVTAMKAEDPTIKVGPSSTPKTEGLAYIQPIAADLSLPLDIVYYHSHMRNDLALTTDTSELETFLDTIYSDQLAIKNSVTSTLAAAGRNPANIPLAITEWAPTSPEYADSPKMGRMVHALASFETVFSFARIGIFDANYMKWPADARDGTEYPVFLGWQALNDHMGDTLVDIYTETNFRMYTTRDSATGKIVVWGLNFNNSTDKTIQLALSGLPVGTSNITWLRLGTENGAGSLESYNMSGLDYYGLSVTEVGLHKANINGASVSNIPFYVPRASMCVLVIDDEATLKVFPQTQTVFWPATRMNINVGNLSAGSLSWSAEVISGNDWLTIASGADGLGSGIIGVDASENPYAMTRTGTIRVTSGTETKDVTVVQGAKDGGMVLTSLNVTPTSRSVSFQAGSTTFDVSNIGSGTMNWAAAVTSGSSWLTISSGEAGTNAGTVTVAVTANTSGTQRTGTIQIIAAGATNSPVDVTVVQPAAIPGDANLDGMVDVGDLGILAANYGGSGKSWTLGDFNHDGLVDVGDLGILAANYGAGVNGTVDFSADYAKAFGTAAEEEDSEALEEDGPECFSMGLPLIAGLLLAGLSLMGSSKLED